ncbi:cytochrome P450 [Hypoxylon rubiginosum]|uniref:Cytochrome P450 n=1 Tax=Hypoxylon rubiginosum TaxID=110542 RepID=A0ACB9Z5H7_9PEZI|nr:cytochrome P450 [Hypoxylon rubiginosum]
MIRTGYRLLLHPLKNYPGPQLAKISDTYSTYHSAKKSLHLATRQAHIEYSPVIRLGPNKLVFNTVEALHDIYDNDRVDKARTYLVSLFTPHPNIFNVIDKNRHRLKRKLIGRLLSESSMKKFEPIMLEQVGIFVQQLLTLSRGSAPINMSDRSKYIGADVVGHLAFGYDLKLQTDPTHQNIAWEFKTGNHRLNVYMQSPSLAMLRLEPIAQLINLMQKKSYLRLLQEMIKAGLKEEKHAKYDLYSHLADYVDSPDGENLSLSEIWSEALFFFPAGGETVTTGIAALFFYLSRSATSYEKLKTEIRSAFTSGTEIKGGPQLAGCQYLCACIDEALRMSPPVPGTLWREQSLSDKDSTPLVIDGHVVPRGVIFGVNIYALHHNEEYFPDPFAFRPERWLASETPAARRKVMSSAFAAFQVGPRGCAGKAMAYLEFSLVVAKTLWYFDLEILPGELAKVGFRVPSSGYPAGGGRREEYQLHDVFTTDHDGPYLIVRPRDGVSKDLETR